MAVQPLNKTKIIKKQKNHPNRFASDKYNRVGVSSLLSLIRIRNPGGLPTVLIAESVVSSEATRPFPTSVMVPQRRLVTPSRTASRSCSSATRKTLSYC